jgi:inward rectifier potassium channel
MSQPPDDKPPAPAFARTLTRAGEFTGITVVGRLHTLNDFYHAIMDAPWRAVMGLLALGYLVMNFFFAILYLLGGDVIANAEPGSFADAFFFSVQTMATIGYGAMAPKTVYANVLVTIEAVFGLFGVAVATGVVFAKFSRPTSRVAFSEVALISKRNGLRHLVFRVGNVRSNQIVEASIKLVALKFEVTAEGERMRRFFDMPLVRSTNPIFAMTWNVMHPIDDRSPLYGMTVDDIRAGNVEILAILTGLDGTFSQTIHARFAYAAEDIIDNARFQDMIRELPDGRRAVDLGLISRWEPVAPSE